MKKIALLLAVAALALPVAAFAGDGKGGAGYDVHLARAQAAVAKYTSKCVGVAKAPARCAEAKTKLTGRLNDWAAKIQAKIDEINAKPGNGPKKAEHLATLTARLNTVKALAGSVH